MNGRGLLFLHIAKTLKVWHYIHVKYVSKSINETQKIASDLLDKKIKKGAAPLVFALSGELGAGKTVFAKAIAKSLGIEEPVNSPTFILMHPYEIDRNGFKIFYHIDAYRIDSADDLIPLGIKEILSDSNNIVLIEWSERVEKIIPKNSIRIHIEHIDENTREITIDE